MAKKSGELKGVAAIQGTAEQVPPGGASDSHRHTWASLLGKPTNLARFLVDTFANLPAGSAANDGIIAYDTTNNRIVYYEAGVRRASAGAMAIV